MTWHRLTALAPAAALALACTAAGCSSSGSASSAASTPASTQTPGALGFDGAALPASAPPPANFTLSDLTDPTRRPVSLASYRGHVMVVAFLYTACGATCTVIAQQIRGALDELPQPVPVLLISADPSADTSARARRFLARHCV